MAILVVVEQHVDQRGDGTDAAKAEGCDAKGPGGGGDLSRVIVHQQQQRSGGRQGHQLHYQGSGANGATVKNVGSEEAVCDSTNSEWLTQNL